MTKRGVLYARVSPDGTRQEGRNLDGQIQIGRYIQCAIGGKKFWFNRNTSG